VQSICKDCDKLEVQLLAMFRKKYVARIDIGREYFEGNGISMIQDINAAINEEWCVNNDGSADFIYK
jgi:hypothetical protein